MASDSIVLDPARKRCMILELKHAETESGLPAALQEALDQINEKKYESMFAYQGYPVRLRYGMAFWNKRALVAAKYPPETLSHE